MQANFFYRFGKLNYQLRWFIIIAWVIILFACIPILPKIMQPFQAIGFKDSNSESAKANQDLNNKLGYSYNRFIILYSSKNMSTDNPLFLKEIKNSLAGLKNFPLKNQIIYPNSDNKQISDNKKTAYAVVFIKSNQELSDVLLEKFKNTLKSPPDLVMRVGGEPVFLEDTKVQTQLDLYQAEYIATPVAIITMLIVFGSVVAASLPTILGGLGAILILTALYFLGQRFTLSVFTLNIALLLGLCLSLDYALLIINRYREELSKGRNAIEAISITQTTAGKAVFFSGLAVFISLSALLLFPINVLFSVGIGGLAAVVISVAIAVILLPAVLSVLHHRINFLSIRFLTQNNAKKNSYWSWVATKVVKRPWLYFISILAILLICGYPFLQVKPGISDFRILPPTFESRQVFDTFKNEFGENKQNPILVIVKTNKKNILTQNTIGDLYNFATQLKRDKSVEKVESIVSTEPRLTKNQYQTLYTGSKNYLTPELKKYLNITTADGLTVMTVISKYPGNTAQTNDLINRIREMRPGKNLTVEITGGSVNTMDVLKSISDIFPYAILWIVGFSFLILLFFLRSIVLPIKAIITTVLSLSASYGVLVLVFQQGYLHRLLHFDPQGMLDITLMIIIFCALFGISMDYEVFLLTRIKEYYEQTDDTENSIIQGIGCTGKIISSAAIIVILLCISFMSADILIVKAFGLGIAIAVFIDAFIIRTLFVPATMTLLGKSNWYLPGWLKKILPEISFDPLHMNHH